MAVVKVSYNGEVLRTRIQEVSWAEFQAAVGKLVPELPQPVIRYEDTDGDSCLVTEHTFSDMIAEMQGGVLRVSVAAQVQASSAPEQERSHPEPSAPPMDGGDNAIPPFLQGLFAQFRNAACDTGNAAGAAAGAGTGTGAAAGSTAGAAGNADGCGLLTSMASTMWVTFATQVAEGARKAAGRVDRAAAQKPTELRAMLAALAEAIEPFPQLEEGHAALDSALAVPNMEGCGNALALVLELFAQQPQDVRRDIAEIVAPAVAPLVPAVFRALQGACREPAAPADATPEAGTGPAPASDATPTAPQQAQQGGGKGYGKGALQQLLSAFSGIRPGSVLSAQPVCMGAGSGREWVPRTDEPSTAAPEATPDVTEVTMQQLASMGFTDRARNQELIQKHGSDVDAIVAELIG